MVTEAAVGKLSMTVTCSLKQGTARWLRAASSPLNRRSLLTLAIESSCDDTCVAILSKSGKNESNSATLHFNEKITHENTGKGGIVPTEALVSHRVNLSGLVDKSLTLLPTADAGLDDSKLLRLRDGALKQKPDFVSVTRGPGMLGNLAVGVDTAKGLATAWQIPLLGVHHMQAHALTPRLVDALKRDRHKEPTSLMPAFPFLTLLVSGGHTMLVNSKSLIEHGILATTRDIAIGDELDKCGRLLLPKDLRDNTPDTSYAKYLSAYAFEQSNFHEWPVPGSRTEEIIKANNQFGWSIPTPMARTRDQSFSFSSISSTVKRILGHRPADSLSEEERLALARASIGTAFDSLASRVIIVLEMLRDRGSEISTLVVSGGVAANDFLRYHLRRTLDLREFGHVVLSFPPVQLCTDNAAMIGWAGIEMFEAGYRSDLAFQPVRAWSMDSEAEDGGIMGLGGRNFNGSHVAK